MLRLIALLLCFPFAIQAEEPPMTQANAHQFSFTQFNGEPLHLADLKGKVIMVVNTASECGFTGQYEELQSLYEQYQDKGLEIIAVPANDFGGQEPGSDEDIQSFTKEKFEVTFPVVSKETVTGKDAHPFYVWASEQAGLLGSPKWNFHKYLIGTDGEFIGWFATTTSPTADKITQTIEEHV